MSIQAIISLLSIIMLLLAVPPIWPYSYYSLLRVVICVSAGYLSFLIFNKNKEGWGLSFAIIAVLFNPFFPIHLEKEIWAVLDVLVAVIFLASMFYLKNDLNTKE